jgi:gliding motility-associated protein GldE
MFNSWLLHFLVKVVTVSFFIVLFAEVMPKVWATHHKIWFASMSSVLVDFCNRLFFRLSKKFVGYSDSIEKRITQGGSNTIDSSNLDDAIDLLPENEASMEEKQILKGIRKFSGTSVKQVMKTRLDVSGIAADLQLPEIIRLAEDLHYSRLPVYRNNLDEIIGVLHIKDLLPILDQTSAYDWHPLIRPAFFVHEKKLIEDLLQDFREQRIHFAVVVDEFGGTSGIVTLEDVIEEITGEIKDEFDDEESVNKKLDENNFIFEGKTMIHDLCRMLHIPSNAFDKYKGESDSLAGLVLEIAGAFPQENETFVIEQYVFTPLEIKKNRIGKVKVTINASTETSA